MSGRILGVDPGEKRIGLAISDPSATIAGPLGVVVHQARAADAAKIAAMARERGAVKIVVGQAMGMDGLPSEEGLKAARLAEAIREASGLPVEMWDESGSTQEARAARFAMGVSRRKRSGHLDEVAATIILQSYLDAHSEGMLHDRLP